MVIEDGAVPDACGPGLRQLNFSTFRNFRLVGRFALQFRAELFNQTNTPQFIFQCLEPAGVRYFRAFTGLLNHDLGSPKVRLGNNRVMDDTYPIVAKRMQREPRMDCGPDQKNGSCPVASASAIEGNQLPSTQGGVMKQFFVLGLALLALVGSGCATRGYARRQAATVNDRVSQVQTQVTALSDKHATDVAHVNERLTATDNKLQEAAASAAQANANAAQANANAARADASAAQANATAARAEATRRRLTPCRAG